MLNRIIYGDEGDENPVLRDRPTDDEILFTTTYPGFHLRVNVRYYDMQENLLRSMATARVVGPSPAKRTRRKRTNKQAKK